MAHLARQKKNALYLSLESKLFRAVVEKRGLFKCH
jgi:stalled ribosome alternative rescue factor ArfA